MITPLRTTTVCTPAVGRKSSSTRGGDRRGSPQSITGCPSVAVGVVARRRRSRVDRAAPRHRRATPAGRGLAGTIVSPTDRVGQPSGWVSWNMAWTWASRRFSNRTIVSGSQVADQRPIPVSVIDPGVQPHRPPLTLQPVQTIAVGFQPARFGAHLCERTPRPSNPRRATPTGSPSAVNWSCTAGGSCRMVRAKMSRCSPVTRPASNDVPNNGFCCGGLGPAQHLLALTHRLVRRHQPTTSPGTTPPSPSLERTATSRPSTHDFNRRNSPTRSPAQPDRCNRHPPLPPARPARAPQPTPSAKYDQGVLHGSSVRCVGV